jgi:hypothetical protein
MRNDDAEMKAVFIGTAIMCAAFLAAAACLLRIYH